MYERGAIWRGAVGAVIVMGLLVMLQAPAGDQHGLADQDGLLGKDSSPAEDGAAQRDETGASSPRRGASVQVEVRGRQAALSDGRTASHAVVASGLFPTTGVPSSDAGAEVGEYVGTVGLASDDRFAPAGARSRVTDRYGVLGDRGQDALHLIGYRWRLHLPAWSIDFLPADAGLRGLARTQERRIEIYVRDTDTAWELARVIAHELGHAVDLSHLDIDDRRAWRLLRRIDDQTPWWPDDGRADFATGAGDFAECFASWQVGSSSLSQVAGPCGAEAHALVGALSLPD